MRIALIVIDCLRYEHSDLLQFEGFQKLSKVVSVSNWTMPSISTMLTGLHPSEHRCCLYPKEEGGTYIQYLNSLAKDRYGQITHETLMDKHPYKAITEIPVFDTLGEWRSTNSSKDGVRLSTIANASQYLNDESVEFLYVHFKGGHSPYSYQGLGNDKEDVVYKNTSKEIQALAKMLIPFVKEVSLNFDRVVVMADHGSLWPEVDKCEVTRGHAWEFGLNNLHVATWLYPNENIPDKLYDTRVAYNFLERKEIRSRQLVFSMSPGYGDYNSMAITYLKEGELVSENYSTKQPFDL